MWANRGLVVPDPKMFYEGKPLMVPVSCTLGSGQRDETASGTQQGKGIPGGNKFAMKDVEEAGTRHPASLFW